MAHIARPSTKELHGTPLLDAIDGVETLSVLFGDNGPMEAGAPAAEFEMAEPDLSQAPVAGTADAPDRL